MMKMRIFDTYLFNIADKVSFGQTKPYLDQMLDELGFSYSRLGFSLHSVMGNPVFDTVLQTFPTLQKYHYTEDFNGSQTPYLSSFSENWRSGEIHADPTDWDDISALFSEMDAQSTAEARLYKALDKIEAVIQHNESDIATWLPLEYDLNRSYAHAETALFPYLKELRALILADTEQKIADGAERGITQEGAEKDYDRLQQLF